MEAQAAKYLIESNWEFKSNVNNEFKINKIT